MLKAIILGAALVGGAGAASAHMLVHRDYQRGGPEVIDIQRNVTAADADAAASDCDDVQYRPGVDQYDVAHREGGCPTIVVRSRRSGQ